MQVLIPWEKSPTSNPSGNSLEVQSVHDEAGQHVVQLRESDDPSRVIETTPEKLAAFFEGVVSGVFHHHTVTHEAPLPEAAPAAPEPSGE